LSTERVSDCSKCGNLYMATSDSGSRDPGRVCGPCAALAKLIAGVDDLVKWNATVDVVSGSTAADELRNITERLFAAANEARTL
jgi:hypothetical protein